MDKFTEYTERKRREFGDKFDSSELNLAFVGSFNRGERITVSFRSKDGKVYETKRGTIGITTGWRPCFLLMLTKRSRGSSYTIGKNDVIVF